MVAIDERTPLRKAAAGQQGPPYVFMTNPNPNRVYRRKIKQFQCFICGIVLASFTIALVITMIYSVEHDVADIKPPPSAANASLQTLLSMSWPLKDIGVPVWQGPKPSDTELNNAISTGHLSLQARDDYEARMASLPVSSPSYRHQQSIKTSPQATDLARSGYIMNVATLTFIKAKKNLTASSKTSVGRGDQLELKWLPLKECGQGPMPPCPVLPYRSIHGTCNNLYRPMQWGVAMHPFRRQLPPDYADGVSSPRVASDGSQLPSAREVSVIVHPAQYRGEAKFTVMLAVWGQFIDHDITSTALSLGKGGKPISCCQSNSTADNMHPECYPVYVSKEDSYYKDNSVNCLEFVRSAPAPACALGPRDQLNQVSSFIDASLVYGNTPQLSRSLRTFQGGQLKMLQTPEGRTLLPISTIPNDGCNTKEENAKGRYCFMSGDPRGNENLHLTTLHVLMARQHNQLAQKLSTLNPDWNDEKLYQESRKIVGAQMQHITYNEFLPILLGDEIMDKLDLKPQKSGYYNGYNSSVDPSASNNFATAAFRFAHSLLPGLIKSLGDDTSTEYVELHKILFNPYSLYNSGQLDRSVNSAITTNVERVDTFFSKQVTQHLFEKSCKNQQAKSHSYGLDLVSLNIQRGRDHGLASYPNWREFCGLSRPKTFDDMSGYVDKDSLNSLKAVYKQVDDIDIYSGALSELPIQGGMLGPTLTCLISDQFVRLKQGDSFWYENPFIPQGFTPGQLNEIRKTSLARIICETSDNITQVQPFVMQNVGPGNTRASCDSLPSLDLSEWLSPSEGKVSTLYTRIGLTVTGGSIETDDGATLWSGKIPTVLQLPLFDSVLSETSGFPFIPVYFGHGIQWAGSLMMQSNEMAIQGTFSLPQYIHNDSNSFLNFTTNWINGKFKFTFKILWNTSEIDSITLDQSYSSPLYLSEQKTNNSLLSLNKEYSTVGLISKSDLPKITGYVKLPIILKGSYSPDKKLFYWSGNLTASVPNQSVVNMKRLTASSKNKTKGAFSVIDGTLTSMSSDGHTTILWSGNPPVQIMLPKCSASKSSTILLYGFGIMWLSSVTDYKLEGSFSFPNFDNLTVTWINGDFTFNIVPGWNISLQGILTPGIKYSTKIILKQGKLVVGSLQSLSLFDNLTADSGPLQSYVAESQAVLDGVVPAPVVLFGNISADGCTFNWTGDVILGAHKSKQKINQQFILLRNAEPAYKSWPKSRFGGRVISGTLSAGLNESSDSIIWSGTLPVSIPLPTFWSPTSDKDDGKQFVFSKGIIWTGTLSGTTMQGEYSLPQCIWNGSVANIQVWKGKFTFDVMPIWNTSLTGVFVPGAKYYSKINFQGTKTLEMLDVCNGIYNDEISSALLAPLILQGTNSPDKKFFYWSGNFIIAFNNGPTLGFELPKPPPKNILGKSKGEIKTSVTVFVSSGQIWASPVGENYTSIWNGELPVTVPLTTIINPNSYDLIADIIWTGQVVDNKFEGNFSIPIYIQNGTIVSTVWLSGNFSFDYTTKWGASLESLFVPLKKYKFQLLFQPQFKSSSALQQKQSENTLLTQFALDAQETLENTGKGKIVLLGDFYSKPFYCSILPFCTDKKEFYWSGGAFFTIITSVSPQQPTDVPQEVNPVLTAIDSDTITKKQQFGAQVVGGYIKAGLDDRPMTTWWTGEIPVNIPLPVFWNSDSMSVSTDVMSNGIIWSGTLYGTLFEGTFSLPQYGWNGISSTVQWWNGDFLFKMQPLWDPPANRLVIPNIKYYSRLNFHDSKYRNLSSSFLSAPTQIEVDSAIPAPIVLQGTYSPDGSTFLWNGQVIISFKNVATELNLLGSSKSVIEPENPSKPIKPTKSSARLTVTGGTITAVNETGNMTEIWTGKLPVAIDLDLFVKESPFSPETVVNMTIGTLTSNLEGAFAVQTYKNSTASSTELWLGNFTFTYATKWGITLASVVNEKQPYSCKMIFSEFKIKPGNTGEDNKKLKTDIEEANDSKNVLCRLVLIGNYETQPVYCGLLPFLCSESNIFYWSGDAILSISQPPPVSVKSNKQLKASTMVYRQLGATIVSGYVTGNVDSQYSKPLWSGDIPAIIPLPVFWSSDIVEPSLEPNVYGHGIIWSGLQIGSLLQGSFSLPQYAGNGMFTTVRWWYGHFSFLLEPSWNLTLVEFIRPGINYNSRIMFHEANKAFLQTPSQDDVNAALHVPIVLLGSYSTDRKQFFWNGRVIIAFHEFQDTYFNDNPYLSSSVQSTNFLQKSIVNKKVKPQTNVGLTVLSSNVTIHNGNATSQWSNSLPVSIPLNLLSNDTKHVSAVNVIWSAAAVNGSQISGNFSLPQTQPEDSNFTIEWLSGSFSFKFITLWNTSINVIQPGNTYSCWLIFKNASKSINPPEPGSLQQLIMDSEAIDGKQLCTIMLVGSLDPNTQMFTWSGQAWINFKMNKSKESFIKVKHPLSKGTMINQKFGGSVYSGEITASGEILWSGSVPVTIPVGLQFMSKNSSSNPVVMSDMFVRGLTWSADAVNPELIGTFSFPRYSFSGPVKQVTWINGEFNFKIRPFWNSSLSDTISSAEKYISNIHFQNVKSNETVSTRINSNSFVSENRTRFSGKDTEMINTTQIILQGEFSADMTVFYWSGNFILSVPTY